ncbi:MAG: rhomboid family intramembrane serine protease [Proteobacteria bacterium]|nr:rhomboid family intramembrane serine protease [Pseudomonadota bacterium]MBU1389068.1 rhomboid family intramembrane serine protease [Pseudomonadota bacterium]MBU1543621.1 rhomboid family intramembrane serine protease [Pseudomonadota bacterium]MBU2479825.1 rhomboid family intramembrane serine protease [Pseudomonadota bacterium]
MNLQTLYFNLSARKANLILLILASQNIQGQTQKNEGRFDILVEENQIAAALDAVHQYDTENRFTRLRHQIQNVPVSSFFSPAAFIIMGIVCAVHAAARYYGTHESLVLEYGASALYILQGEHYRAITALFFHADVQHLLGNMAGLLIFGAPVIRILGYGTGPFALLVCGAAGNLMNAHLYRTAHLSIGASTSIMAGAGLLCAFQALQKKGWFSPSMLTPVFAGAILMALLSQGENTDVWAHVFGFVCGLFTGLVFFPLDTIIRHPLKQPVMLFITIVLIILSVF